MVLHRGTNRIIQAHDDTTEVVIRSSSHARCVVAGWQLGRLGQDDVLVHSTDAVTRRLDLLVIILDSRIRHWNLSALQRGHQYNYEQALGLLLQSHIVTATAVWEMSISPDQLEDIP